IFGKGVILDGWDFTGIQLLVGGNAGDTPENVLIRNCKFAGMSSPAVNLAWGRHKNVTIEYCEITGSNTNDGIINWAPSDRTTPVLVQYCYIHDNAGDGPNWKI